MTSTIDTALEILKQDRKGRLRTPRAKQEEILDEYERSGMSGVDFSLYQDLVRVKPGERCNEGNARDVQRHGGGNS